MGSDNREMLDALSASVNELRQRLDMHCRLVADILGGQTKDQTHPTLSTRCPKPSRTLELKDALQEAIVVLEESRKAFKSKKLEALRKKLTFVLINAG